MVSLVRSDTLCADCRKCCSSAHDDVAADCMWRWTGLAERSSTGLWKPVLKPSGLCPSQRRLRCPFFIFVSFSKIPRFYCDEHSKETWESLFVLHRLLPEGLIGKRGMTPASNAWGITVTTCWWLGKFLHNVAILAQFDQIGYIWLLTSN